LQVLLGAGAQFRGQQEPAIRSIMEGHSPVMVVMGTGGGKSMLFMLPASSVSGGITIVVVPLVALQGDLQQRCEQAQISSVVWDSQQPHTMASIIFVTPESAVSKTFANCINRWQEMCQIERIVIDESHCMLEGSPSFRPKLRQLGELVFTKAQMVYLTATLPPRDEAEFFQLMHIQGPELKMFRGRTTRANVAYRVQEVEVEEESPPGQATDKRGFPTVIQDAVLQLVQEKLQQYPAPAKIIIYSSSIAGAKQLGELLECEVYYRDVDSRDGKARRLEDWRRARDDGRLGQGRVIVATNALGLGVDVPDIRAVCHVGKIWELRGYAQGSGRAGRDGEKSEAIIIRAIGVGGDLYPRGPQIDIAEFIEGVVCRRIILDAVMDAPRAREGCEDGEEKCDVCRGGEEAFLGSPDRFPDSGIGSSPANQADPRPAQIARSSPPGGVSRRGAQGGFSSSPFRFHPSSPCPVKAPDHSRIEQMRQRDWTHFRVSQQRRREGQEVQELVDWLDEWHRECPLCHLRGFQGDRRHRLDECWREEAHPVHLQSESMTKQMQELKAFERFSCCMWCGIPQAICDRWQPIEDQGGWAEVVGGSCQYAGLLMPAIITMMMEGCEEGLQVLDKWFAKAQVHKEHSQDVCRWFGKQIIWGGIQATQMVQVFHMLAKANRF
jgi:superfamily II DNA or RNA helicase